MSTRKFSESLPSIEYLVGKTIISITEEEFQGEVSEVRFKTEGGTTLVMYHEQGCCEDVRLIDRNGDWEDLISSEILVAEERTESGECEEDWVSQTYTFYTIRTLKGSVDLRWLGESNGYYSESVDFKFLEGS